MAAVSNPEDFITRVKMGHGYHVAGIVAQHVVEYAYGQEYGSFGHNLYHRYEMNQ